MSVPAANPVLEDLRPPLDTAVDVLRVLLERVEQAGGKPMLELVEALERAGAQIPPAMKMFLVAQA